MFTTPTQLHNALREGSLSIIRDEPEKTWEIYLSRKPHGKQVLLGTATFVEDGPSYVMPNPMRGGDTTEMSRIKSAILSGVQAMMIRGKLKCGRKYRLTIQQAYQLFHFQPEMELMED